MTNSPETILREQLDLALSKANCNYVENQLWKEKAMSECLSSVIQRKAFRHALESAVLVTTAFILTPLLLHDSSNLSLHTLAVSSSVIGVSYMLLEYFLRSREKLTELQLLSKLWDELAEPNEVAVPDESHIENALHG